MAPIRVEWEGPAGPKWVMEGPVNDIGGIVFISSTGLVASVDRASVPTSHRRGVQLGPVVVGEMTGTMGLVARGGDGRTAGDVYEAFLRTLSTLEEGRLTVVDGRSARWHLEALVFDPADVPELSPRAPGRNIITFSVEVRAAGGVWLGDTEELHPAGGVVTVRNRGSLTVYPTIVWSGQGCRVVTPLGVVVSLPTVPSPRHLVTDPGRGFVVMTPDGEVDTVTRRAMRGLPVWGELLPGRESAWKVLSGQVHFEVTPMIENPWR